MHNISGILCGDAVRSNGKESEFLAGLGSMLPNGSYTFRVDIEKLTGNAGELKI